MASEELPVRFLRMLGTAFWAADEPPLRTLSMVRLAGLPGRELTAEVGVEGRDASPPGVVVEVAGEGPMEPLRRPVVWRRSCLRCWCWCWEKEEAEELGVELSRCCCELPELLGWDARAVLFSMGGEFPPRWVGNEGARKTWAAA